MKLLVGQSGGPTVAINSSLAGVIKACIEKNVEVYGLKHGIEGLFKKAFVNLNNLEDRLATLKLTPAMALGSCRYKLQESEFEVITKILLEEGFTHFVYIGGNDSMDTVDKLGAYFLENNIDIKIIGVPKTIDNDLAVTDHTPGYGSAARFVYHTIQDIYYDAKIYDMQTVVIVEIMGRNAGWLTLAASLPRCLGKHYPHIIAYPEKAFDEEEFLNEIKELQKKHKIIVCAVSEGIKNSSGEYYVAGSAKNDQFDHKILGGVGKYLEQVVTSKLGCKCRSVELNVLQRSSITSASAVDLDESFEIGRAGALLCLSGETAKVMTYKRISNNPYKIEISYAPSNEIANLEKTVPLEMINLDEESLMITRDYLLPLVKGEVNLKRNYDSLADYLDID